MKLFLIVVIRFINIVKFYATFNVLDTYQFSSITQSCPTLCNLWISACQASLSKTNSWCLFKLMSIKLVMPSNHLILCHPLLFLPQSCSASGSFPMSQFFASGGQNIGASTSASVLPMNIRDWFPLGWTGWISLQSEGLSRIFSNTTLQKHHQDSAFFIVQSYIGLCWSNPTLGIWACMYTYVT